MINFLTSLGACELPGILRIIYFIKVLFNLICFVAPIGLLLMMALDFFKSVTASNENDMSKNTKLSIKRVIFCCAIFFVPTIVNLVVDIVYDSTGEEKSFLACYENANLKDIDKFQAIYDAELQEEEDEKTDPDNVTKEEEYTNVGGSGSDSSGGSKLPDYEKTIYIGDSRTVGMCLCRTLDSNEDCSIAKGSMGINWFENTAIPSLKTKLANDPEVNVVIKMGANDMLFDDLYNDNRAERYSQFFNQLVTDYPKTNFVIVSVTQVDDQIMVAKGLSLRDKHAVTFNRVIRNNLSSKATYCDVYSKIKDQYETSDGIHYSCNTYDLIYNEIQKCL